MYGKHIDKQIQSFLRNGVKIWNSLPREIRHLSKNNFKIKIHNILLQRLSEENDKYRFICLDNKNILILWLFIFAPCIDLILDDIYLIDCILCTLVICIPIRSIMYCS